jgi:ribosome-binding factor A
MRHKRSIPNRGFRVADQIQRDVAELIRDLKDPRIGMVTIHAVEVTPDYAHAKVFFSVLVGDAQECETALNEAAGYLRNGPSSGCRSTPCRRCTSCSTAPPSAPPS